MRTRLQAVLLILVVLFISATLVAAQTASIPVSDRSVVPLLYPDGPGGNVTCDQVGVYEFSSGRLDGGAQFGGTVGPITWSTVNNTFVSWSGVHGGLAVILKGGPGANVYFYDASYTYDSGLASPPNPGGNIPTLSNITFCWNPPPPQECEWIGETAWAAGSRYVSRGNWATYTPYVPGSTVTLFAGQTMNAGTVSFSAPVGGMVEITVTLNSGWRFEAVDENVKIQDYAVAPSGHPAPGLFAHKGTATGSPFSVWVPQNNFYGVHVNVEWERCE